MKKDHSVEDEKILVILGQTTSGKSALAVDLARKFNGEVISVDSRQVYRGLNLGAGKITKKEMRGVPHHLLDVASPRSVFTAADFKERAFGKIHEVMGRGRLPILCGGSGFYLETITGGKNFPPVLPNRELRKKLGRLSTDELFLILQSLDPRRAAEIDSHNPHRLIRAIEISQRLGSVPKISRTKPPFKILKIGLTVPPRILKKRIRERLLARIKRGMIKEVKDLHENGLSFRRLKALGLEYRFVSQYLERALTRTLMIEKLEKAIYRYARRQMTWFKRDKSIRWFTHIAESPDRTVGDECDMRERGRENGSFPVEESSESLNVENREVLNGKRPEAAAVRPWSFTGRKVKEIEELASDFIHPSKKRRHKKAPQAKT